MAPLTVTTRGFSHVEHTAVWCPGVPRAEWVGLWLQVTVFYETETLLGEALISSQGSGSGSSCCLLSLHHFECWVILKSDTIRFPKEL